MQGLISHCLSRPGELEHEINHRNDMMFKPKAIWAAILLLFAFPLQAALQFDTFIGYDGNVHEAGWFPVLCEVFNDGPGFNAMIEVTGGQFGNDQTREIKVELPSNTRKRIFVPMFASGGRFGSTWNARLKDEKGKILVERLNPPVRTVAAESSILGALPRSFSGTPVFPEMKQNRQDLKPAVARLSVEQVPDNPIALEGLNAFYLNSEKALELKANQVAALIGWVREGGHLILGIEQLADVNSTPWLKQFIPMELTDTKVIKLNEEFPDWIRNEAARPIALETTQYGPRRNTKYIPQQNNVYAGIMSDSGFNNAEIPVVVGQIKDAYPPLVTAAGIPLVVQAPRGRGKITLLAFSPEREPFRSWKTRSFFWAKLTGIPGEFFANTDNISYGSYSVDGVFGALIDSRQIKKLPVTWLLLLLVVYLVVIGPFDRWWLKKINRQMLTWITFPSYVVLFSLLIYFIGYKLRAGETEWNQLNIVDVLPRGDKVDLRGRTYISIYSSGNARYKVQGENVAGRKLLPGGGLCSRLDQPALRE
jgi:hypothetical protein